MLKLKYANSVFFLFFYLHISNVYAQDTTQVISDSVKIYPPLKSSGRVLLLDSTNFITISKLDIQRTSYTTLFDIIKSKNLAYPLSLGFYGQNNSFSFFGAFPRSLSTRWSNTPNNAQDIGIFNLSQFPPEQIENAQIFIGSDAIILSNNANGALINFQESIYNTKNPYSKLVYSQASDDFLGADGVYSQNFANNWNFSLGFRILSTPGRFTNSKLQTWNFRASVRYNFDSLTSISISENYSHYSVGENGGVDYLNSTDLYDPIAAIVLLNSVSSSENRNNLIIDFNKVYNNYNSALSSKFYFSHSSNKFNDGNNIFLEPSDSSNSIDYVDYYIGNSSVFENKFDKLYLSIGIDAYFSKIQQSKILNEGSWFNFSLFELLKYNLTNKIKLSFGTRYFQQFSNSSFSYGGKIELTPDSNQVYFIDFSNSIRIPSLIEKNVDSENHLLGILGFHRKWKTFEIGGQLFARQITNPIIFSQSIDLTDTTQTYFAANFDNSLKQNIFGLNLNFNIEPLKHIVIKGFAQFSYSIFDDENAEIYPGIYGGISGYYYIDLGRSQAQVGLDIELLTSFKGYSYFPGYAGYYSNPRESKFQTNGLNLFARLKLGNAFVRLEFRNALGANYYYVPFYPELGRHFRFIVNWAFMD